MKTITQDKKWNELGIADKVKISIAGALVTASILIGFVSFYLLYEIPTSLLGLEGIWLSTALAVLGIASYFNNEMTKFQAHVQDRLNRLDKREE